MWVRLLPLLLLSVSAAPGQPPTEVPAQQPARAYRLPPDKLAKAIEYAHARNRLHFIAVGYGILVLAAVIGCRVAPGLRNWAERLSRRRLAQAYLFATALAVMVDGANLPLALYEQHLSRQFEQSIQSWPSWLWDWTKGELLSMLVSGFLLWMLYGVIRRSPRRWWLYFWLMMVPLVILLLFITPVLIEPLFFRFEPLAPKQPALAAEIERVVARGGLSIPLDRMYEMKASEKLRSLNASVQGLGASKRVVVWDTTIRQMTTGEILFVFGHEMGHYVLGHTQLLVAGTCLVLLAFLFLGFHVMRWALARWGEVWRIRGIDDWASLPVLLLAVAVFGFVSEPVLNSLSRTLEHDADIYGLEVIHGIVPNSAEVAADAFQKLGEVGLSDPNPSGFIQFWLYDHPSIADRVRFAAGYDPWSRGQTRYVK
jgi:STE24 endopeptidase